MFFDNTWWLSDTIMFFFEYLLKWAPTNEWPQQGPTYEWPQQDTTNEWPQQGPGPRPNKWMGPGPRPNRAQQMNPLEWVQQGPTNEWAQWARAIYICIRCCLAIVVPIRFLVVLVNGCSHKKSCWRDDQYLEMHKWKLQNWSISILTLHTVLILSSKLAPPVDEVISPTNMQLPCQFF